MDNDHSYIKLFRKMLTWGWYGDTNTVRVFLHILLRANHKPGEFRGYKLQAGDCIFGRKEWAEELGLSEQEIRTAIDHLKSTNEITTKSTNRFTIVHVEKWEFWQIEDGESDQQINQQATNRFGEDSVKTKKSNQQSTNKEIAESIEILMANGYRVSRINQQATNKQPTSNQQATTSKEYIYSSTTTTNKGRPNSVEEVRAYVAEKGLSVDPDYFWEYYEDTEWKDVKGKPVKNWKLKARTWSNREKERNGDKHGNGSERINEASEQRTSDKSGDGRDRAERTQSWYIPEMEVPS